MYEHSYQSQSHFKPKLCCSRTRVDVLISGDTQTNRQTQHRKHKAILGPASCMLRTRPASTKLSENTDCKYYCCVTIATHPIVSSTPFSTSAIAEFCNREQVLKAETDVMMVYIVSYLSAGICLWFSWSEPEKRAS